MYSMLLRQLRSLVVLAQPNILKTDSFWSEIYEQQLANIRLKLAQQTISHDELIMQLRECEDYVGAHLTLSLYDYVLGIKKLVSDAPTYYQSVLENYLHRFYRKCRDPRDELAFVHHVIAEDDITDEEKNAIYNEILYSPLPDDQAVTVFVPAQTRAHSPLSPIKINSASNHADYLTLAIGFSLILLQTPTVNAEGNTCQLSVDINQIEDKHARSEAMFLLDASNMVSPAPLNDKCEMRSPDMQSNSFLDYEKVSIDLRQHYYSSDNHQQKITAARKLTDYLFSQLIKEEYTDECAKLLEALIEEDSNDESSILRLGTILAETYMSSIDPRIIGNESQTFTTLRATIVDLNKIIHYLKAAGHEKNAGHIANRIYYYLCKNNMIYRPIDEMRLLALKHEKTMHGDTMGIYADIHYKNHAELVRIVNGGAVRDEPFPFHLLQNFTNFTNALSDSATKVYLQELVRLSEKDTHLMLEIGRLYRFGYIVHQSNAVSDHWINEAAKRGNIFASVHYALSLDDLEKANQIYQFAIEHYSISAYQPYILNLFKMEKYKEALDLLLVYIDNDHFRKEDNYHHVTMTLFNLFHKYIVEVGHAQRQFIFEKRFVFVKFSIMLDNYIEAHHILDELITSPHYREFPNYDYAIMMAKSLMKVIENDEGKMYESLVNQLRQSLKNGNLVAASQVTEHFYHYHGHDNALYKSTSKKVRTVIERIISKHPNFLIGYVYVARDIMLTEGVDKAYQFIDEKVKSYLATHQKFGDNKFQDLALKLLAEMKSRQPDLAADIIYTSNSIISEKIQTKRKENHFNFSFSYLIPSILTTFGLVFLIKGLNNYITNRAITPSLNNPRRDRTRNRTNSLEIERDVPLSNDVVPVLKQEIADSISNLSAEKATLHSKVLTSKDTMIAYQEKLEASQADSEKNKSTLRLHKRAVERIEKLLKRVNHVLSKNVVSADTIQVNYFNEYEQLIADLNRIAALLNGASTQHSITDIQENYEAIKSRIILLSHDVNYFIDTLNVIPAYHKWETSFTKLTESEEEPEQPVINPEPEQAIPQQQANIIAAPEPVPIANIAPVALPDNKPTQIERQLIDNIKDHYLSEAKASINPILDAYKNDLISEKTMQYALHYSLLRFIASLDRAREELELTTQNAKDSPQEQRLSHRDQRFFRAVRTFRSLIVHHYAPIMYNPDLLKSYCILLAEVNSAVLSKSGFIRNHTLFKTLSNGVKNEDNTTPDQFMNSNLKILRLYAESCKDKRAPRLSKEQQDAATLCAKTAIIRLGELTARLTNHHPAIFNPKNNADMIKASKLNDAQIEFIHFLAACVFTRNHESHYADLASLLGDGGDQSEFTIANKKIIKLAQQSRKYDKKTVDTLFEQLSIYIESDSYRVKLNTPVCNPLRTQLCVPGIGIFNRHKKSQLREDNPPGLLLTR